MKNEYSSPNTLAHELVAKEEQNISIFFAAFAIQFYLHKDMLIHKLNPPNFLKFFGDIELFASQRVLIKNIIFNKKYKSVLEEMERLFMEYNNSTTNPKILPYDSLLNRINKAFLIRQIFEHTDTTLSRYLFIRDFLDVEIGNLNLDDLDSKMATLNVEQKILILVRIFINMHDEFEGKKKMIMDSFLENTQKMKEDYNAKNKKVGIEYNNLELFLETFQKE